MTPESPTIASSAESVSADEIDSDRKTPWSDRSRWTAFLLCALVIVARAPRLLIEPRMVAEEGYVYLSYAFSNGFLRSLLLIPTSEGPAGYLNLVANLGALLSTRILPLEMAPTVGTGLAFLAQLLPFGVILWGRSQLWRTPGQRHLLCLLLLFACPVRPEVWLQVINAQIFIGLAAFLLLFEDLENAGQRRVWTCRGILAVGTLTGAYTVLLAPIFLLRYRLDKSREALNHLVIVAIGAVLQAAALLASWWLADQVAYRLLSATRPEIPISVFLEHFVQPILGSSLTATLDRTYTNLGGSVTVFLASLGVLVIFSAIFWLSRRCGGGLHWLFPSSLAVLIAATSVLAHGSPTSRYAVLPGIVFLITLLIASWNPGIPRVARALCLGLLALGLFSGLLHFWAEASVSSSVQGDLSVVKYRNHRPRWTHEVAAWRQDPQRPLKIWPYSGTTYWRVHLSPQSSFQALRGSLARADDFHLVVEPGATQEFAVEIPRLPPDFRILIEGSVSPPSSALDLQLHLLDSNRDFVVSRQLRTAAEDGRFAFNLPRRALLSRANRYAIGNVDLLSLTAKNPANSSDQSVVEIRKIDFVPRVRGLLDDLLPTQDLPRQLYTAWSRSPVAQEALPILALESILEDGDVRLEQPDRERATARWIDGVAETRPGRTGGDLEGFDSVARGLLILWLPLYALAGPAGIVGLNWALLIVVIALCVRHRRSSIPGRLFAAGAILFSLATGFALLPQSTSIELFCLLVPILAWLDRRWVSASQLELSAYGLFLAFAISINPVWLTIATLPIVDTWRRHGKRPTVTVLGSGLALLLILGLAVLVPALEGSRLFAPLAVGQGSFAGLSDLYASPSGLLFGFPFAILAIVWLLLRETDPERMALAGWLILLMSWLAWTNGPTGLQEPLGDPRLAVLLPLFTLLPRQMDSWWPVLSGSFLGLLVTWGTVSAVWTL